MNGPVEVHVEAGGRTIRAGTAFFHVRRRSTSTTFTYDPAYLADTRAFPLDPGLPLVDGSHHAEGLPGSFGDCSPDRWGRNLITKRLRIEARLAEQTAPSVGEVDLLLGVSDQTRQGALRFRRSDGGPFLSEHGDVPKLVAMPRLLRAAEVVAREDGDDLAAVKALLDAGSGSLGGARPKASVAGPGGQLHLAKFPHRQDEWDVSAWEMTVLDLAERAGLAVPDRRLVTVGPASALVLRRFDRTNAGRRIPYISALSLLEGRDGDAFDYVDVAERLEENGQGEADLHDLYRRVVLSVVLRNTDDHLRNLGLLRSRGTWSLAPVFDVNPDPDPSAARRTTIAGADHPADEVEGLVALAGPCHLTEAEAGVLVAGVLAATAGWREVARGHSIRAAEVGRFADSIEPVRGLLVDAFGSTPPSPRPSQPRVAAGRPGAGRFA